MLVKSKTKQSRTGPKLSNHVPAPVRIQVVSSRQYVCRCACAKTRRTCALLATACFDGGGSDTYDLLPYVRSLGTWEHATRHGHGRRDACNTCWQRPRRSPCVLALCSASPRARPIALAYAAGGGHLPNAHEALRPACLVCVTACPPRARM